MGSLPLLSPAYKPTCYICRSTMRFVFAMLSIIFVLFLETEAGCNDNGCCWCGSKDGEVIYTGPRAPDRDLGIACQCIYLTSRATYYGSCTNQGASDINVAPLNHFLVEIKTMLIRNMITNILTPCLHDPGSNVLLICEINNHFILYKQ